MNKTIFLLPFIISCGFDPSNTIPDGDTYLDILPETIQEYPEIVDIVNESMLNWKSAGYPDVLRINIASRDWGNQTNRLMLGRPGCSINKPNAAGLTCIRQDLSSKTRNVVLIRGLNEKLLRRMVLHELGHFIGLDHSASNQDLMFWTPIVNDISEGDVAAVHTAYHID